MLRKEWHLPAASVASFPPCFLLAVLEQQGSAAALTKPDPSFRRIQSCPVLLGSFQPIKTSDCKFLVKIISWQCYKIMLISASFVCGALRFHLRCGYSASMVKGNYHSEYTTLIYIFETPEDEVTQPRSWRETLGKAGNEIKVSAQGFSVPAHPFYPCNKSACGIWREKFFFARHRT